MYCRASPSGLRGKPRRAAIWSRRRHRARRLKSSSDAPAILPSHPPFSTHHAPTSAARPPEGAHTVGEGTPMSIDIVFVSVFDLAYTVATLALVSAGLALIFGLMRVINLAHGEFIVLGGYATIVALRMGCNIGLAMLIVAPIVVGCFGFLVERLVIRHLYGRTVDTMLATWGLSLAL